MSVLIRRLFFIILAGMNATPTHNTYDNIRNVLIKILLGTVIAAAAVAVGVILIGTASDLITRVIWTIVAALCYVVLLLAIISTLSHIRDQAHLRSTLFVTNSLLALTCASYLTSILSIWGVITGDMPMRLHVVYFALLCGVMYAKPLIDLEDILAKLRNYIWANYLFIAVACGLFALATLAPSEWNLWNGIVGRMVAASVVIDVTLSMVITVLFYLQVQQHRREHPVKVSAKEAQPVAHRTSAGRIVLWTLLGLILLPFAVSILGNLVRLLMYPIGY